MKKSIKVVLASTMLLGTFAITNLDSNEVSTVSAAEYVKDWYSYKGYAGYDATFVLDKTFVNAVKEDNVKMNNIQLKMNPKAFDSYAQANTNVVKKYDQTFKVVKGKNYSYSTMFDVNANTLTVKKLKAVYGNYIVNENKNRIDVNVNGQMMHFDLKNGVVKRVTFGL